MDPSEHRQNNEIHPRYLLRLHCIDGLDNNTWLVKLVLTQCVQIISGAALTFLRLKRFWKEEQIFSYHVEIQIKGWKIGQKSIIGIFTPERQKKFVRRIWKGTIHILRNHIFRIFEPPPPLCKHVFSTENNQKLAFSDPLPPTSDYVIYEWSLNLLTYSLHRQWCSRFIMILLKWFIMILSVLEKDYYKPRTSLTVQAVFI